MADDEQEYGTAADGARRSRPRRPPVLLSVLLLSLLGAALSGQLDRQAGDQARAALTRAMVTFGVARTLNGLISVVQETEVALQPAGIGVSVEPGQLLDPLNDLIERFSWVMMASGVALGIQTTLLRMAAWWPMNIIVSVAVIWLLWRAWRPGGPPAAGAVRRVADRLALTVLFVRLVLPVVLLTTAALSDVFLRDEQAQATQRLAETAEEVAVIAEEVEAGAQEEAAPEEEKTPALLERLGRYVGDRLSALDVNDRIDRARELLGDAASQVVTLTASFLLETVLIPLLLVWLIWRLLTWSWQAAARAADP